LIAVEPIVGQTVHYFGCLKWDKKAHYGPCAAIVTYWNPNDTSVCDKGCVNLAVFDQLTSLCGPVLNVPFVDDGSDPDGEYCTAM
jgi:hypothetical protein